MGCSAMTSTRILTPPSLGLRTPTVSYRAAPWALTRAVALAEQTEEVMRGTLGTLRQVCGILDATINDNCGVIGSSGTDAQH